MKLSITRKAATYSFTLFPFPGNSQEQSRAIGVNNVVSSTKNKEIPSIPKSI
jgi:hypothetical protein